jgi:hypothetical protein
LQTFISGCVEKIGDVTDKLAINTLVGQMSYRSAHYLAIKIIFQDEKDDGVEGYYKCPRCQEPKICEANDNPDLDTRDYLSDLKIVFLEDADREFEIELDTPVEIKDESNGVDGIFKLKFRYPTLNDCSMAFNKVGEKDTVRLQFQVYIQALTGVNDGEVDNKFKNNYGMYVFEKMERKDIARISDACEKYGLVIEVMKICNKCQKEFKVHLNTSNFFGFALQ